MQPANWLCFEKTDINAARKKLQFTSSVPFNRLNDRIGCTIVFRVSSLFALNYSRTHIEELPTVKHQSVNKAFMHTPYNIDCLQIRLYL